MDLHAIHRWTIVLEWISFVLVTPEILGPRRLKQLGTISRRAARVAFLAGDAMASLRMPTPVEDARLEERIKGAVAPIRLVWGAGRPGKEFLVVALLPVPILIGLAAAGALMLRGPARLWVLVPLAVAPVCALLLNSKPVMVIMAQPSQWRWPRAVPLVAMFLIALSFGAWAQLPATVVSYALLRLSETRRLRGILFATGAFAFTVAKAIDFWYP